MKSFVSLSVKESASDFWQLLTFHFFVRRLSLQHRSSPSSFIVCISRKSDALTPDTVPVSSLDRPSLVDPGSLTSFTLTGSGMDLSPDCRLFEDDFVPNDCWLVEEDLSTGQIVSSATAPRRIVGLVQLVAQFYMNYGRSIPKMLQWNMSVFFERFLWWNSLSIETLHRRRLQFSSRIPRRSQFDVPSISQMWT